MSKASSSDLAIVFVSSDSDDESFAEYYGSMPWYSVPYSERDLAQSLGKLVTSRIKQLPYIATIHQSINHCIIALHCIVLLSNPLGTKHSVRGIPAFIVLDASDGSTLDTNGRSTVTGAKGDISKALATWKTK